MTKKYKFPFFLLAALALVLIALVIHYREHIAVLSPKGLIALQERDLIILSTVLMLIVVMPVLVLAPLLLGNTMKATKRKFTSLTMTTTCLQRLSGGDFLVSLFFFYLF